MKQTIEERRKECGNKIKEFRLERGYNQVDFGKALGYSNVYLSVIENGQRRLPRVICDRIKITFGLDLSNYLEEMDKDANLTPMGKLIFKIIADKKLDEETLAKELNTPCAVIRAILYNINEKDVAIKLQRKFPEYIEETKESLKYLQPSKA